MSTPRVGRAALKKAKVPVPSPQRTGSKNPVDGLGKKAPATSSLPKRANAHLANLQGTQNRMSPKVVTILGVSILGMSTYCGYLYASYRREVARSQSVDVPQDVSDRYNRTARTFDADVEMSEKLMRMGSKRQDLVRKARGDVLEVSCGTGRNIGYYELVQKRRPDERGQVELRGCRSLTFVDLSPQMVEIAREKFRMLHPGFEGARFRAQDAKNVGGLEDGGCYDTVVQTMGLCSMPDPVGALRHYGEITEPTKGRILLLEHGRSHYRWLNRILDNLAPAHADRHGCWWNRDIGEIVRESGLEIVEEKRWHFGTTWKYVLRPRRSD
ncbi:hypothetical protein BBP40_012801 [Aspergillus hancockii]|nr:hypothetical protein BBP40_012801 [Aspergillus hancockii]